ncbi:MAG TPA: hypothetical protein PK306_03355 [Aquabacterium sp.]|nr:hypothetical protein [Aquabacterium sp.]HQC94730.1 hypothetical protein [Aquabacterium sp.]
MLQYVLWTSLVLAGGVGGWLASAWLHQRRIQALQVQMRVMRQTMGAHSDQARRQIGQLQAELAQRPLAPQPERAVDVVREKIAPLVEGIRRRPAAPDRYVLMEDGFPQTAVVAGDAFAPTQMIR